MHRLLVFPIGFLVSGCKQKIITLKEDGKGLIKFGFFLNLCVCVCVCARARARYHITVLLKILCEASDEGFQINIFLFSWDRDLSSILFLGFK